jgi:FMN phosphatase YigB (HAD superfamily)
VEVKGILLDLDDTLYEYDNTHKTALTSTLRMVQEIHDLEASVVNSAFEFAKKKLKSILPNVAANHSRILYFQLMMEFLNIKPIPFAYDASNIYWDVFLKNMNLTDDAVIFLEVHKDIPICLITDLTAEIQYRKIDRLGLIEDIDYIVTSEEAGVEKPHPFIFKLALSKLKLSTSEVVMIGDNYSKDIIGANLLGIRSFWVNRNGVDNPHIIDCCTSVRSLIEVNLNEGIS